jgi:hypothetical protein
VAVGIVTVLGVVAAAAGSRGQRPQDDDVRRSTYLTGPHGARAYAEALELLGVPVVRLRARTTALAGREGADELYAALDPSAALSPLDALHLRRYAANGGRLLLAGAGAVPAMQCFGQVVLPRFGGRALLDGDTLRIGAVLQAPQAPAPRPGLMLDDGSAVACPPFPLRAVDTLLAATDGEPVVLRIASDSAGTAILVADGTLFSNRALRTTAAGELALSLAAEERVVV